MKTCGSPLNTRYPGSSDFRDLRYNKPLHYNSIKRKVRKGQQLDIPSYHLNFVNEEYDEKGILKKFSIKYPDNFNFAYDIIDKYGEMEPDRRALMWVDLQGNEKVLTYGDLSKLSNRAANMFRGWGIKKGDKVMLVLKRN